MKHHPEIVQGSRHGDMLENTSQSGYRSHGVYMISKNPNFKVIELDHELDDYGGPSHEFSVITDFPLDYWHYSKMTVMGGKCQSYWHCGDDEQWLHFDGDKLRKGARNIKCSTDKISFEYDGKTYSIEGENTCDLSFDAFCDNETVCGCTATTGTCDE